MSGVYIAEFFFPDKKSVLKIGCSKNSIEKRIFEIFKKDFNGQGGYTVHGIYPCDKNTVYNLENFIINTFMSETKLNPIMGKEFFYVENRDEVLSFVKNVDVKIIQFFDANKIHAVLPKNIGALIKSKRNVLNISQSEIGKSCGMRQATISGIENGKIGRFESLKKICDTLSLRIIIINDEGVDI